jgi:PTH1 family peptidyl-tRNA hydrolase
MNQKLIIGLGNPGNEYEHTYHNTGYLFIDYINNIKDTKDYILFKPESFMNESGIAVSNKIKQIKISLGNILIIHDDSDLILGKFKFSFGRNSAGHKGIESIIKTLKTKNFWRLRIGIRPEIEKDRKKADKLVLQKITKANMDKLYKIFGESYVRIPNLYSTLA